MKIRVLALNDDNHATTFHTANTNWTLQEFIKEMAKPHTSTYEIRGVYLCDIEEIDIEVAFELIQHQKEDEAHDSAFERLWNVSTEDFYI